MTARSNSKRIVREHARTEMRGRYCMHALFALICTTVLYACGGGGSGGGDTPPVPPPTPEFGLMSRPAFAGSNVPTTEPGAPSGSITVARAFPNLNFDPIVYFAGVPGEARNVVLVQSGQLRVFADDETTTSSAVVLDLANGGDLLSGGEQGLLGLAFDPAFARNRAFYVQYTARAPLRTRVSRFIWDAATDRASLASEHVLLEIRQPFGNHKAGMIAFGPDGALYIAQGDGGSGFDPQNNGQNQSVLLGKMLRIQPPIPPATTAYVVPRDNPFAGTAGVAPEIWASGLRNPYRFSFDRETGELWAGDVGQNTTEEIDVIRRGLNYGWRVFEGTRRLFPNESVVPAAEPPVHEYDHSLGVAVIGGYVYRGTALPALYGNYVYGDYGSSRIWALTWDGSRVTDNVQIATLPALSSFGEDNAGELRMTSLNGTLHKFVVAGGTTNAPPARLSQTGLFTSVANSAPVSGLIEYDINHAFWSDGTRKRRWLAIPDGVRIGFDATGSWQFPIGTIFVKQFEIELQEGVASSRRRLETRVLARRASGWYGLVYRWRGDGSDADLLADRAEETLALQTSAGALSVTYEYPSRTDCLRCHNDAAGGILGARTTQLNRNFAYSAATDNQLRALNHVSMFMQDIGDASQYTAMPAIDGSASISARARAYLDVNCSSCHQPGGGAPVNIDLRAATALVDTGTLNSAPQAGDLGIAGASVIASGSKERSLVWQRMRRLDDARMPPVSSHRVDNAGVDLIGNWIDSL